MDYKTKILSKKEIAEGTLSITLERPKGFIFKSGHYVQLALEELIYPDPKGQSRTFSLCSSPSNNKELEIAFRTTQSGYKKTMTKLDEGSELALQGPYGYFTLPEATNKHIVCVAGGIGIAPFISMIRDSLENKDERNIHLIYANRSVETSAYNSELLAMSQASKTFSLENVYGRITAETLEKTISTRLDSSFWVVGPPRMVVDMRHILVQLGVPENAIHSEEFTGY